MRRLALIVKSASVKPRSCVSSADGAETPVAAPAEQNEPRSAADAAATASEEANI